MEIKDFIKGRNVEYGTVYRYIKRNPKLFKNHIGKGNNIVLDDIALEILDKQYPLPKPVQIIQDTTAREEVARLQQQLLAAKDKIIALQTQLNDNFTMLLEAEELKVNLLEETTRTKFLQDNLDREKQATEILFEKIGDKTDEIISLKNQINALKKENEMLKNRGVIARIKNELPEVKVQSGKYDKLQRSTEKIALQTEIDTIITRRKIEE